MARQKIYRVKLVKEGRPKYCEPLTQPKQVYEFLKQELGHETREVFVAIFLNARHLPLHWAIISIGSLSASLVHPRDAFAPGIVEQQLYTEAIAQKSAAVIIVHNHPSGDTMPSNEDKCLTERLVKAGEILGIEVLDHIIIGESGYFSFKERGLL